MYKQLFLLPNLTEVDNSKQTMQRQYGFYENILILLLI